MGNPASHYEDLIRDVCGIAGIAGWQDIAQSHHMTIEDRLIGLIPDYDAQPARLHIYFELGPTHSEHDGALYEEMLVANVTTGDTMPGRFGLHPESHRAVYGLSRDLESLSATALAELLEEQLGFVTEMARQWTLAV